MKKLTLLLLLLISTANFAQQTYTFIGNGSYFDASNWENGLKPSETTILSNETVIVNSNATLVLEENTSEESNNYFLEGIIINNGHINLNDEVILTIEQSGTLNNYGFIDTSFFSQFYINGKINNRSKIFNGDPANIMIYGYAQVNETGWLTNSWGGDIEIDGVFGFVNYGFINNYKGGTMQIYNHDLFNYGRIVNSDNMTIDAAQINLWYGGRIENFKRLAINGFVSYLDMVDGIKSYILNRGVLENYTPFIAQFNNANVRNSQGTILSKYNGAENSDKYHAYVEQGRGEEKSSIIITSNDGDFESLQFPGINGTFYDNLTANLNGYLSVKVNSGVTLQVGQVIPLLKAESTYGDLILDVDNQPENYELVLETVNNITQLRVVSTSSAKAIKTQKREKNSTLSVFPNPTSGKVNISAPVAKIEVFNLAGELVFETSEQQLDISSLTIGVYIFKINTSEGKQISKKVVLE